MLLPEWLACKLELGERLTLRPDLYSNLFMRLYVCVNLETKVSLLYSLPIK